ncbi:MAG: CpsD/CapB family tyrosine-protein kinase [Armatimonadota bacterium]|nr:CpsD/CapB family tyrosine-protein kinase [Armatimonadota bacterium]MDR5697433.1 CpsD/CapB family tyrosine-protein kinase [Armatimonadota bacterium]
MGTALTELQAGHTYPALAEAYGRLLANLLLGHNGHPPGVVAVTSVEEGDGATTTAVNLAKTIASSGARCLLVDGNLRRPELHRLFDVDPRPGLADLLADPTTMGYAIRITSVENLDLVAAGESAWPPQRLIDPRHLQRCFAELRQRYPYVVIDTPAVRRYPEALTFARTADGVLLVIPGHGSSRQAQREAYMLLERVDANVLGAVLNRVPQRP